MEYRNRRKNTRRSQQSRPVQIDRWPARQIASWTPPQRDTAQAAPPKTVIDSFVLDSLKIGGILTNPRPISSEQLKNLYEKAWAGKID